MVRGQPGMVLLTTDLWSAALAASGEADGERAWGLTRRQFMKRVNGLGMKPAGHVTRRGRGWRDWRLLTDEEVNAARARRWVVIAPVRPVCHDCSIEKPRHLGVSFTLQALEGSLKCLFPGGSLLF